ncbi:DUF5615 family PIN-like protein [Thioalkalivibrio sp. ALJT]|uniref:DUF5615 family PIN-like protein n=1 Tax=Thioalkalivibrio sp. ALJT TaxID=1158146 RepID=UPI001E46DDF5|nr:DUF5615 family PIN-like protein [Thioalkalivibrio sp. ALJT]
MRFLVDAQLPPALARWLVDQGVEAEHVADVGMLEASDREIWAEALRTRAVIVTPGDADLIARPRSSRFCVRTRRGDCRAVTLHKRTATPCVRKSGRAPAFYGLSGWCPLFPDPALRRLRVEPLPAARRAWSRKTGGTNADVPLSQRLPRMRILLSGAPRLRGPIQPSSGFELAILERRPCSNGSSRFYLACSRLRSTVNR